MTVNGCASTIKTASVPTIAGCTVATFTIYFFSLFILLLSYVYSLCLPVDLNEVIFSACITWQHIKTIEK